MNEHVKDVFSRMLGTKQVLPKLVHIYERVKFLNDRVAPGPIPVSTLVLVVILGSDDLGIPKIRLGNGENRRENFLPSLCKKALCVLERQNIH